MQKAKKIIKNIYLIFYIYIYSPLRLLFKKLLNDNEFVVLVYHRVSDEYKDSVTVGIDQFKKHIEYLKKNCHVFNVKNIKSIDFNTSKTLVAITFDDGYDDNYHAAEILASNGLTATFFLTTRIVGTRNGFRHDLIKFGQPVPALSWCKVEKMHAMGHTFGSHTSEHVNLSSVAKEVAVSQIENGRSDLLDHLGAKSSPELFAYPHGRKEDFPSYLKNILPDIGIEYCFSAYGGVNSRNYDKYDVRRQGIDCSFSFLSFRAALLGRRVKIPPRS